MKQNTVASIFYYSAIALILSTEIYISYIFRKFIFTGNGIGIYGIFFYFFIFVVSSLLWFVSYKINRNKNKALFYWAVSVLLLPIILVQPTWWAAPI